MRFVFFGPPGAGKGTMAVEATEAFGIPHISSGEMFRAAIREETPLGLKVKDLIGKGGLVPDELTIDLVHERLSRPDLSRGWILDGFPRTISQARSLSALQPEDYVISFEVDDAKIVERLSGRRMCRACGRSYHIDFSPPREPTRCDACGGALYTREDDSLESVRNRLIAYRELTEPLKEFYAARDTLVPVDASGAAPEAWAVLRAVMSRLLAGERL